jgi:tol-pal system-associated acyl-CoA thioesterase
MKMRNDIFCMKRKVYYHDTDAGGVVYHGRYLEFLEDGRTEFLLSRGIDTGKLRDRDVFFVVAHIDIDYRKPAVYLDEIIVSVAVQKMTDSSIHFRQEVSRNGILLVESRVILVCVGKGFRPKRLPPAIKNALTRKVI